ncbi:mechanosensitive ion channel protein MscS [Arthrobacter livingstonensis]|uniref:Mechanosensitive ion channel protein MscS n=1 Tax=Arthrobacter livingstonensis TaxID=670078 RepID=A0A2V5L3B8_9MICC|nr:mechanosensitive ion channel protein MscS [Arthrobacter livingstonensis]
MPLTTLEAASNSILDNLIHAGIAVGISLLAWLILHYLIRIVVKRAEKGYWHQRGLGWVKPVFRNLDPVMRALDNERRVQRARTIGTLLNSLLTVIVVVIAAFYVLLAFEVNIAPLLASVGVVGIAIGFGSQQLIRDFLAGIFITLEDQYGIGDVIQTSEVIGQVEYVGLRITRVRGEDGTLWYLRNGEILRLGNRSKGNYVPPEEQGTTPASPPPGATHAPPAAPPAAPPVGTAPSAPSAPGQATASSAPATPLTTEPHESAE